jgi:hypothetical protein
MKKIIIFGTIVALPLISFAATAPTIPITTGWVTGLICTVLIWMFWGLLVLGTIMVLVGAYIYVTSSGEPAKVSKASKTLLYAAIGIAIAIIAKGVPSIVGSVFGQSVGVCESTSSTVNFQ